MSAQLKITDAIRKVFEEQAELRAHLLQYKDLEQKTGLSRKYIANVISRMVKAKCELIMVSRGSSDEDNRES